MKLKAIFNSMKFKIDKNSPEILVVAGVAGMIGATILACRATVKAKAVKEEKQGMLDIIDACEKDGKAINDNNEEVTYSKEDAKKDRKVVKIKAWLKYGKIFAPAIFIGALSVSAILFGHNILRKRYISLGSAYTALDKAYAEYRKRVEDKYGPEAEKDIRFGKGSVEGTSSGSKEDEPIDKDTILGCSPYARFFDSSCKLWTGDPEQDKYFLLGQQNVWTNILQARGYLSLNEVYVALGFEPTAAGQTIGWIFDKDHMTVVDFGIHKMNSNANRRFVNGLENVILLDFNVTGDIRKAFKGAA